MKKLNKISTLLLVIFTMSVIATSCSKDKEDEPNGSDSALVGTWVAEGYDYKDDESWREIFTFKSNGTGSYTWIYDGDRDYETFSWTATDRTVTMFFGDERETYYYSISSNGNVLRWDWDDEAVYYRQ